MLNCLPTAGSGFPDGRVKLAAFIYSKQSDVKQSCAQVCAQIPAFNSEQANKLMQQSTLRLK